MSEAFLKYVSRGSEGLRKHVSGNYVAVQDWHLSGGGFRAGFGHIEPDFILKLVVSSDRNPLQLDTEKCVGADGQKTHVVFKNGQELMAIVHGYPSVATFASAFKDALKATPKIARVKIPKNLPEHDHDRLLSVMCEVFDKAVARANQSPTSRRASFDPSLTAGGPCD